MDIFSRKHAIDQMENSNILGTTHNIAIVPHKYNIVIMKLYVIIMIKSNWRLNDNE